jgi:hypothetical protein
MNTAPSADMPSIGEAFPVKIDAPEEEDADDDNDKVEEEEFSP